MKIKSFKVLFFYETCKLTDSKKKLSKILIRWSHWCSKFLHINIKDDEETLEDLNDLTFSFQEYKYFVLIMNDVIRHQWIFFMKRKFEIYDIIIYIMNHFEVQEIKIAFMCSD